MRSIIILVAMLAATIVSAQNLIINPDFDLDPTITENGWSTIGTGVLEWNQSTGDPSPPSAHTLQENEESMILFQCVAIIGGTTYDFSARSFTHAATGLATNGVTLSFYDNTDCTGEPIETVTTNQLSFPNFAMRSRSNYLAPVNAQGARIELTSTANGTISNISWDNVMLLGNGVAADSKAWSDIKDFYR